MSKFYNKDMKGVEFKPLNFAKKLEEGFPAFKNMNKD